MDIQGLAQNTYRADLASAPTDHGVCEYRPVATERQQVADSRVGGGRFGESDSCPGQAFAIDRHEVGELRLLVGP